MGITTHQDEADWVVVRSRHRHHILRYSIHWRWGWDRDSVCGRGWEHWEGRCFVHIRQSHGVVVACLPSRSIRLQCCCAWSGFRCRVEEDFRRFVRPKDQLEYSVGYRS